MNQAKDVELQKAKVKRAKELVQEAGDMDMGDASIMFTLAAIMAQHKRLLQVASDSVSGKQTPGMEHSPEVELFQVLANKMGPEFERIRKGFLESEDLRRHILTTTYDEMKSVLARSMSAWMALTEIERRGIKL